MWKRLLGIAILVHASFGFWAASGNAAPYPNRPIRLIDGFAAGGRTDYIARVIGPKLTERFGQTVIVDNRPGAAGNLGAEITARANPDGYTLLMGAISILACSPSLYPKLGYDLMKDFAYVSMVATGAFVLLAHPSVPAKSVSELVALARSKPNAVRYGSGGVASGGHLVTELLQKRTGMELLHVPYKGGALQLNGLMGGEIQVLFASIPSAMPLIQAKRLNALAVSSAKRSGALPGVPAVQESGFPGFDVTTISGILAPSGTPVTVVTLLNAQIRSILQMDDVRTKFAAQGLEAEGNLPAEFRAITKAEIVQWARVIKDAHITAN